MEINNVNSILDFWLGIKRGFAVLWIILPNYV